VDKMNQTQNLTQFKNIEDKKSFCFSDYRYQRQNKKELGWEYFREDDLSHNKHINYVYRLVIQPDKYYYWAIRTSHSFDGIALGKDLLDEIPAGRDMIRINQFDTLRPAKPEEIPKRVFTQYAWYPCRIGQARYVLEYIDGSFRKINNGSVETMLIDQFDSIGKAAAIYWENIK